MDVEVNGARVLGVGGEHALDRRDRLADLALGRPVVGLPVVPGRGVHDRIGEQHGDLVIVLMACGDVGHGSGVGLVERLAIGRRRVRVAGRQSLDQRPLARARLGRQRLGLSRVPRAPARSPPEPSAR